MAAAEGLLVATYDSGMSRSGPGILLQHLTKADDPQIEAGIAVLAALKADLLVLTDFDYDHEGVALAALQARLKAQGLDYPEALALRPNTGIATGLDLDHDGALAGPRDAQAYGRFAGQAGMAILSKLPIDRDHVVDFSTLLWRDLPGANLPPALAPEAAALQRLSTAGHYAVPVTYGPGRAVTLLLWAATPPIFDGPEDRNGRRNADEAALWLRLLEGKLPKTPDPGFYAAPVPPFLLIGEPNMDPQDGDGLKQNLRALMALPGVQDPMPRGTSGRATDGGAGAPALDTALFKNGWGLRLDMILPSRDIAVAGAGVLWPPDGDPLAAALAKASRHRPVWLRLTLP